MKLLSDDAILFPPNEIIAATENNKVLAFASEKTNAMEIQADYFVACVKQDLESYVPKKKEEHNV